MENQSLYRLTGKEPVKVELMKGPVDDSNRIPVGVLSKESAAGKKS